MLYLLDTNIIIAAMKGQTAVRLRLESTPLSRTILSPVVLGELQFGAEKSAQPERNHARVAAIVSAMPLAPMDASVSGHYARLRAVLERQGTPIGSNDTWIAAHALALGAVIVTDNVGEFSRVPGLAMENWTRL